MVEVVITHPGERVVEEFQALVARPTSPSGAPPPAIGLVEISQSQPTQLIPGPVGPQGLPGADSTVPGPQGPPGANGSPDTAAQVLAKLVTVDGTGSNLDADLLDGQSGSYYLDRANHTGTQAESTVTNLVTDLAAKAPLASPTFTGDPKAPTPTAGDNDTSIATTAFVTAADTATKAAIVGSASTGMDTLGEIENYIAANITPVLGNKADIFSPTFTGDPKAPTPATADSDTSIATTAFVKAQGYIGDAPNDGTQYARKSLAWAAIAGTGINNIVQTLVTSSGSYSKRAGLKYLSVEGVGPGGGGAQAVTPAANQFAVAAGAGAGAYGTRLFTAAELAASTPYTIGAAGTGGAVATGGSGGTSEFGSGINCTLGGGVGATRSASTATVLNVTGGVGGAPGSGWTIGNQGENGHASVAGISSPLNLRGAGGGTRFGWVVSDAYFGNAGPNTPAGYGGGAGGQVTYNSTAGSSAPAGGPAMFLFTEYF